MIKLLPLIFLFNMTSAYAQDILYSSLNNQNEETFLEDLISLQKMTSLPRLMIKDDKVGKDADHHWRLIFSLLLKLNGLPKNVQRKIQNITWGEAQFFGVDFELCPLTLSSKCEKNAQFTAKNHRTRKHGYIFINRKLWESLDPLDKYTLIWHEILGVLGVEKDSYTYSSLVEFYLDCHTAGNQTNFSSSCSIEAHLFDPSFSR